MSTQAIREFINRHSPAVTGLAALGALLDARASGKPLDPALEARLADMLDALGARDALADLGEREAAQFANEIRQSIGSDYSLLYAETRDTSWSHTDPRLLQSAGDFSRGFARGFTANLIKTMEGLPARFAGSDARFLDIGVGVAGLSIELATLWPQLKITGIDVWQPALALARENVAAAGLADRIELREQAAESLTDERAFDLIWMPMVFMPERIVPAATQRAFRALKPGGWVLFAFGDWDQPDLTQRALWRLRTTMFGGPLWPVAQVQTLLRDHGFSDVQRLCAPPGGPVLLTGRRAE